MSEDHFKKYREHTAIKHAILKDYLGAWVPILGSWKKKICYIDGFCGPGSYEVEDEVYDGSPVIALKIAEDSSDKVEVICIFIDKEEDYCNQLQVRINQFDFKTKYYIECEEFETAIEELLDEVPHMVPAFCFIDPFGYSGIPLEVIKRFLARRRNEAFITFMYEPISRWIAVPEQHPHMDELFGTDKWRRVLEEDLRSEEREIFLRGLYHRQLKKCAEYVWPFKLRDPDKAKTIYYLFHCTNHPKGIKVMKEIMYRKGTVGTYSYQGKEHSQIALFSTEPQVSELEDYLLEEFAGQTISFVKIIDSTLELPFIEKHYRQAINNLRDAGIVEKIPVTTKRDYAFSGQDKAVFPSKKPRRQKKKGFFH